jgi:alkylation response protein AidB-like acyl-CoA dehydrogenase
VKFAFNEEQEELRRSARAFLRDQSSGEQVRAAMESDSGYDEDLWRRVGAEMGWTAVTIPEQYGGLGLGYVELVALLEEMGATLPCIPFFSSIALGANAFLIAGTEQQKGDHLPGIAAGETVATLALTEKGGGWDADSITTTARLDGSDYVLDGAKAYVPDGPMADGFVVAARLPGTNGEDGVRLFCLPADQEGVSRTRQFTMDQTRPQAEVVLHEVRVPGSALMNGAPEGDEAWPAITRILDLAAIALAAEQVGGAQRCLDMSVQYAQERIQFGRAIGSFQAVKHKLADMMLQVESARSAAYYAGWAAAEGEGDVAELASIAKAYCSDAFFQCAADSIQIHGGVGFTWEYDVHLFFKRAKSSETLLGDAAYHRELVARRIALSPAR